MKKLDQKGFTLVELLVVITILAILATIAFTIFSGTQKSARDARRRADIDAIATAMETHYGQNGQYSGLCQITSTPTYDCNQWFTGGLPQDPQNNDTFKYCTKATGTSCISSGPAVAQGVPAAGTTWVVCAALENSTTPHCRLNRQ